MIEYGNLIIEVKSFHYLQCMQSCCHHGDMCGCFKKQRTCILYQKTLIKDLIRWFCQFQTCTVCGGSMTSGVPASQRAYQAENCWTTQTQRTGSAENLLVVSNWWLMVLQEHGTVFVNFFILLYTAESVATQHPLSGQYETQASEYSGPSLIWLQQDQTMAE